MAWSGVRRPSLSSVVHTFNEVYIWSQLVNRDQILFMIELGEKRKTKSEKRKKQTNFLKAKSEKQTNFLKAKSEKQTNFLNAKSEKTN